MSYLSLYRKYRSQTFSDLIGQDHVVRTLQNAVATGKIAHSYLFTGPRGTGKTSSARLLAKCLNCEKGPTPEPCNVCEACVSITQGNCVDVYELDAASESGVENVRETIVEAVQYQPNFCRFKVFIIDEVHDLSNKAFDALLKTIEEPPSHVVFILATTEYNKVPPTIRSRCQKYEFHRASMQNLVDRLSYVATAEAADVDPAALTAIARMADGGYRDALTLLEQALLTSDGKITLQHVYDQLGLVSEETVDSLLIAMRQANIAQLVDGLGEVARRGRDPRAVIESMMYRLADLTRAAYTVELGASGDATREASLFETATRIGRENLLWLRGAIAEAHREIRDVTLPRIWLEAELIRISLAAQQPQVQQAPKQAVVAGSEARPMPTRNPHPQLVNTSGADSSSEARPMPSRDPHPQPLHPSGAQTSPQGEGASPVDKWKSLVADLTVFSKAMGMRLATSRGREEGTKLVIEFERQMDVEWMTDKPQKQAAVLEKVRAHYGTDYSVDFVVGKNGNGKAIHTEPEAVELPAEGERLEQMAREVFKPE